MENYKDISTHLFISDSFDFELTDPNITQLTFGDNFNQPIEKLNFPNLTHITFGKNFNQQIIKDIFPPNVTHITFGKNFMKSITEHNLPKSVKFITVPCDMPISYLNIPVISIEWSTTFLICQLRD
ncbi:MAG TPA: FNIP repeat-containing protein [Aquella sp.]|nr:FNIP repeat-containing protein [Aquella sp.]